MSDIGKGIKALIQQDATAFALAANRIFPLVMPQGTALPAYVYQIVSSSEIECKGGGQEDIIRVQVSAFAKTYGEVVALSKSARNALENFSGLRPEADSDPVKIALIRFGGTRDLYEEDSRTFHRVTDYLIQINS